MLIKNSRFLSTMHFSIAPSSSLFFSALFSHLKHAQLLDYCRSELEFIGNNKPQFHFHSIQRSFQTLTVCVRVPYRKAGSPPVEQLSTSFKENKKYPFSLERPCDNIVDGNPPRCRRRCVARHNQGPGTSAWAFHTRGGCSTQLPRTWLLPWWRDNESVSGRGWHCLLELGMHTGFAGNRLTA